MKIWYAINVCCSSKAFIDLQKSMQEQNILSVTVLNRAFKWRTNLIWLGSFDFSLESKMFNTNLKSGK